MRCFAKKKIETADMHARQGYLGAVVSEIRVNDHRILIVSDKARLPTGIASHPASAGKVIGFVRKWRTTRNKDANL
jgi:hypothetical protein